MTLKTEKISDKVLKSLQINAINPGAYCGEEGWLYGSENNEFESINPAVNQRIASVIGADDDIYEQVMASARNAAIEWAQVPAPKRGQIIREIGEQLRNHKDALGTLVSLEMGKIKQEGDGEVQEMIDMVDFAVGQARMLYGKTMHSERLMHRMYEQWHPLGVVGVITAFNFPVAVWAWNAMLAAIAGNSVVWRPSPKTPLCAIAVQNLCRRVMEEAGYPGVFSLFIEQDNDLVDRFVRDPRVALVSFTGSSVVGNYVSQTVAARFGKSLLELSGNNALIVDETADLDLALPAIVFGSIGTAGQRCTTTRRLFVHNSIYDELLKRLINAYSQVVIGDPLAPETLMGPLIDKEACEHYFEVIHALREAGGDVLYLGAARESDGFYVSPCIARVENHWGIVQKETFGPLLYVIRYHEFEDAVAMQNEVPQGLSSALFTNDLKRAEYFLSHKGSDCGIANINIGTSGAEIGGAFGGEKQTGGGREAGSDAWQAYMRRQTNTINWSSELPLAQGIRFEINS